MAASVPSIYRFEGFELDPSERRLTGPAGPISLTPKVFDTLVLLVERANRIVTKEEIVQAIWPRGFIDDSNLTKHIWLIRKALGENERTTRFIETVPKTGYRFVAPVTARSRQAFAESVSATEPASTPQQEPRPLPPWRRAAPYLIAAIAVLAITAIWLGRPDRSAQTHQPGRAVAFVGFSNLSGNPKDGWIAPALTEMLSAELNAAADLHVIPEELIRDIHAEMPSPAASGYSLATLRRISRRLDADYVVSGSYLVSSSLPEADIRVALSVQDAHTGALLASPTFQAGAGRLTTLVGEAGVRLRNTLNGSPPDSQTLGLVANAQPPTTEVARHVGFALDALQHYDAARARDELLEAIAQAPGYPLAYMHLAEAWTALGYQQKALAAAEQAARYATHLSREQQLQAREMVAVARADWPHAVEICQSLIELKPLNPEYRLQCIDAYVNASEAAKAQLKLAELRKLPGVLADPRVELAAARVARALDDAQGEADHATAALRQARSHEAPGLIADAQLQLAQARQRLGNLPEARTSLVEAAAEYHAIHNPRGEARTHVALGNLSWSEHQAQIAREEFQTAMALYQSIADQAGMASVYRAVCDMLWDAGDRDGAQTAARHGLQLAREVGDAGLEAWTLRALATIASDDAATDEVVDEFRQVLALTQKSGDRGGHVWSLAALADIERLRGALSEAQTACAQAKMEAAALSDRQFAIYSGFTCAQVAIDRGESAAARAALNEVMRQATDTKYPVYSENARMSLAQLDMDERNWTAARDELRGATRGFAADDIETGEADAVAMFALCEQALGERTETARAIARAHELRQAITSRQEVYLVDIALARLDQHQPGEDVDKLLKLAADADRRHFVAWSLEARLAAWELLRVQKPRDAEALRAKLESDAQRDGFGRILNRLRTTPGAATITGAMAAARYRAGISCVTCR